MRVGILVSVLGLVCSFSMVGAWAAAADDRDQALNTAWKLAWQIQDDALRGSVLAANPFVYPRAQWTAASFNDARYQYVDRGTALFKEECADGAVAVTSVEWNAQTRRFHGTVIYLCPTFWDYTPEAQAQTIIHEAAHWAGYKDECVATAVEIYSMNGAGRVPFRNGYIGYHLGSGDRCGYAELFPYRNPFRPRSG